MRKLFILISLLNCYCALAQWSPNPSLNNAIKSDKPKHKLPAEEIDLETIHACPFCGNMPKRIELDENNNLKYTDL